MHLPKNPIIQESKKIEKVLLRSPIYPPFHGAQTAGKLLVQSANSKIIALLNKLEYTFIIS